MRFAALQGSSASDYAAAGKLGGDAAARSFAITRKYGPNYGEIAQTGMKARSAERIAAMQTGAQVAKAGIKAVANVQEVHTSERAKEEVRKAKTPNRMAGGIAALGSIGAAAFLSKDNTEGREVPTNTDAKRDLIENHNAKLRELNETRDADRTEFKSPTTDTSNTSSANRTGADGQTGSSAGKGTGGVSPSDPSKYGNAYMSLLTEQGMSKSQAAALTGHLEIESDNFRADTEYAPNAYGTRGRGHLQWTDTGNSGGRRSNFEAFSNKHGLDPKSFQANSQFLLSEMQGNHGNHWTNGGSYDGFLQTNSVQEASTYLQNNYIRPGVPHTERRLNAANNYFNNFQP